MTLFRFACIFSFTVATTGLTKSQPLFDRSREGKKDKTLYVSKKNRLSSLTDLKINSRLMDWDRKSKW